MRVTSLALFLIFFCSCSHVRLKYEAQVAVKDPITKEEKLTDFVYYKSFEVGGLNQFICGLTAAMWGGWCWSYLGLPTETMKEDIKFSAEEDLHHKLGKYYAIEESKIDRHNFDEDKDLSYFILDGNKYQNSPFNQLSPYTSPQVSKR